MELEEGNELKLKERYTMKCNKNKQRVVQRRKLNARVNQDERRCNYCDLKRDEVVVGKK